MVRGRLVANTKKVVLFGGPLDGFRRTVLFTDQRKAFEIWLGGSRWDGTLIHLMRARRLVVYSGRVGEPLAWDFEGYELPDARFLPAVEGDSVQGLTAAQERLVGDVEDGDV